MSTSKAEQEREQRLRLVEDEIGRHLAESTRSGELQRAPSFGKPLNLGDGYEQTPAEFRMPMKILKDAGVVPPEVEAMQQIAALEARLAALVQGSAGGQGGDSGNGREGVGGVAGERGRGIGPSSESADDLVRALRREIAEKRQALALRLERLRISGSL